MDATDVATGTFSGSMSGEKGIAKWLVNRPGVSDKMVIAPRQDFVYSVHLSADYLLIIDFFFCFFFLHIRLQLPINFFQKINLGLIRSTLID